MRENIPPRLEDCQAMYDKEHRLRKRKSVRPNTAAVEYHGFQEQQHEEFLTLQLPLSTGKLGGLFARNSTITYTWISDLAFQWHFCVIFEQLNPKLQRNRLMCATFSVHSRKYSQSLNDNLTSFDSSLTQNGNIFQKTSEIQFSKLK